MIEVAANNGATLVVCPLSVLGHWQRELSAVSPAVFDARGVLIYHGPSRTRIPSAAWSAAKVGASPRCIAIAQLQIVSR